MSRIPGRERGQAIALAAVIMVAMIGMVAFVTDAGVFLVAHNEIQKAVDAGAEAGIVDLALAANNTQDITTPGVASRQNAVATAEQVTQRNLGISRGLCTVTAPYYRSTHTENPGLGQPGAAIYNYALADQSGIIVNISVTVECNAGYTFGRILDLFGMQIGATGTSSIGGLKGADCPIPFAVTQGPNTPPTAQNAWGWNAGELMVLQIGSGYQANPITDTITGQPAIVSSSSSLYLAPGCSGAPCLNGWLQRNPCAPLQVSPPPVSNFGGNANQSIGQILPGFASPARLNQPGGWVSITNGKDIQCSGGVDPRATTPPVADLTWHFLNPSPCLASVPVLDNASYAALVASGGGGNTQTFNVVGFALFYISSVDQQTGGGNNPPKSPCYENSGTCIRGYYLKPAINGQIGAWNWQNQPVFRPIR